MLTVYTACILAIQSALLLAIADIYDDAVKLGLMSDKTILSLAVILFGGAIIVLNKRAEMERIKERESSERRYQAFIAHHENGVVKMNAERAETRKEMKELIVSNTAAFVQLKDVVQVLVNKQ